MSGYQELPEDAQVELLRRIALEAAPDFGLEVAGLDLVAHLFNTTFALQTPAGQRFALRVNTNSMATAEHIAAQQEWQLAISRDTDVQVPEPLRSLDGDWFVEMDAFEAGRSFRVVVNSWLPGENVEECDETLARALGGAMAKLHEQASSWEPPAGFPRFDHPLFGDPDLLSTAYPDDPGGQALIARSMDRAGVALAELAATGPAFCIHGDLHGANLKWHQGRLAIFDFDDSGISSPVVDLGIATFYLRVGTSTGTEAALREGYADARHNPLLECSEERLEAVLVARQLLLANSLLQSSTERFRAMTQDYLACTLRRLRHWESTGRFALDV